MRESAIEAYLVKRVTAVGGEVRKVKWVGRRGAPDRLVLLPSFALHTAVWVELKAPGVEPEPHQLREHERLRRFGQRVAEIDSREDVEELLR